MATVVFGDYEWDDVKAATNLEKHGVSFAEAFAVLEDPHAVVVEDSIHPERVATIGLSAKARILYVVHVERGDRDRIISARRATREERLAYFGRD